MSSSSTRLIPSITALLLSRAVFIFLNDPEGPNLLVVTVLAVSIYCASHAICSYTPLKKKVTGSTLLLLNFCVQVVLAAVLVIVMKLML
jgi:hypothetical protein